MALYYLYDSKQNSFSFISVRKLFDSVKNLFRNVNNKLKYENFWEKTESGIKYLIFKVLQSGKSKLLENLNC